MSSYIRYSSKGPELLIDMVDQMAELLATQGGLSKPAASVLAVTIANQMAKTWGGRLIYFPKGTWNGGDLTCFQIDERNLQIEREYNGTNRDEICTKFSISPGRLYQIISAVRLARRTTVQAAPSRVG